MSAILSENCIAFDTQMSVEQAVAVTAAYAATFDAISATGEDARDYSRSSVLSAALLVLLAADATKKSLHHAADAAFELVYEAYGADGEVKDALVEVLVDELGVELTFAYARRSARVAGGAA